MARNVHKEDVELKQLPQEAIREDRGLRTCGTPQLVLASTSDVISYKNDRTAIAFKFDTMTIELESSDGTLTAAPGIAVSFPNQSDAVGYVIDWRQLVDGSGDLIQGCYKVKVNWTLAGNSGFFYYGSYQLLEYSTFNARGTTRLYVVLNDFVRKQGINYKDSGFAGTVRFKGIFGFMQPNYDIENNTHINRERYKVRNESVRTYELRTDYLLECQTRLIDEQTLLVANQIYVTDHNAGNHNQSIYDFPVILDENESPSFEYPTGSVYAKVTAKFVDKVAHYESKYNGNIQGSENVILELPATVAAGGTTSYTVEYENGVVIDSGTVACGGNILVVVPGAPLNTLTGKTGQTTPASPNANYSDGDTQRGRGVDFFTLSDNNPFGNNLRFTGTTGTGIIQADGIMIDWLYRSETSVHTWFTTPQVAVTFNDDIATAYASTFGGLSNWFLPNKREQDTIMNHEISIATNYPPLNATPLILRTCTEDPNDTTKNLTHVPGTHTETSESKAFGTPRRWMPFRITLLSELGL